MRRAVVVLWVAVLCVMVVCSCKKKSAEGAAPGGGKRGAKSVAFTVETAKVEVRGDDLVVTAPGVVDAFEHIQVTARVSGVLDKVAFTEGQEVKRGQILAYIDSRRYSLSVSSAKAALAKSEATAADTEAALKRRENATSSTPGLIPGEEIESYRTKARTAHADVDQAREALKLAMLNLEDSAVKAAAAGIIQTRNIQTGQYVQAGTVIASLLQRDPMLLRFHVATSEAPRLKVGMPVEFTLKESEQVYTANISLIAASAEAESRLVPVTAEVQVDKKFWLRPGTFAQVRIKFAPARQFPMIPTTAARPSDRGFLAYVVDGDVVHERQLKLGLHTADGYVEVREGLQAGETLVVKGIEALSDGAKVTTGGHRGAGSGGPRGAGSGAPGGSGEGRRKSRPDGSGRGASSAAPSAGAP